MGLPAPSRTCRIYIRAPRHLGPALRTEFSGISGVAAGTVPGGISAAFGLMGLSCLSPHLEQLLGVHTSCLSRHIHPCKCHHGSRLLVGRRRFHSFRLSFRQGCRRHIRIGHHCSFLQFLDHILIFLGGFDGVDPEGNNFNATKFGPLG